MIQFILVVTALVAKREWTRQEARGKGRKSRGRFLKCSEKDAWGLELHGGRRERETWV